MKNCDGCGAELRRVWPDTGAIDDQLLDVLHIELSGGYAEFIDAIEPAGGSIHARFCAKCAWRFLNTFPRLRDRVLEVHLPPIPDHIHERSCWDECPIIELW